jgi:hypothetical protein
MRAIFDEFVPAYYRHVADTARTWLTGRLTNFRDRIIAEIAAGTRVPNNLVLLQDIQNLENYLQYILSPY